MMCWHADGHWRVSSIQRITVSVSHGYFITIVMGVLSGNNARLPVYD